MNGMKSFMKKSLAMLVLAFLLPSPIYAATYAERVQQMYVAYYGRPGDPGGIDYWVGRLEASGGNLSAIIESFGNSDEYRDRYSGLSSETLVNNIFLQLFGRNADAGGLAFYTEKLDSGELTLASIALNIADGVQEGSSDAPIVANKLSLADSYSQAVRGGAFVYSEDLVDAAIALLSSVNGDSGSLESAIESLSAIQQQSDGAGLLTGHFIGGLGYTTESQQGVTSSSGEFSYLAGESITFYLGDNRLPAVSGAGVFTPLGYVPSGFSENDPAVTNLTRLLQSLDTDLDPSNGIQLPASLSSSVSYESAVSLEVAYPIELFERLAQVLDLLTENNLVELINAAIARAEFQSELERRLNEFIIAAAGDDTPIGDSCTDVRNGFVSPFPCIPGSGGFAVGNLTVESNVTPELLLPVSGGSRYDTIYGDNGYINDMHGLAGAAGFGDPFEITDFADSLNVGIVLFTTTDENPFRDDVIQGSGWEHTELFFGSSYIGNLPFTSDTNLQQVMDRCGLASNLMTEGDTRRLILPPGDYSWSANAYETYGCRSGTFCPSAEQGGQQQVGDVIILGGGDLSLVDPALVEQGQSPIWEWSGDFQVESGTCTVVYAEGTEVAAIGAPDPQGEVTELYGHYYGSDWEDYTANGLDGNASYMRCEEYILDENLPDDLVRELYVEVEDGYLVEGQCPIKNTATYTCKSSYWGGGLTEYTWNPSNSALDIARDSCEGEFEVL